MPENITSNTFRTMNFPRPCVHFKSPELDLQMTFDNAKITLYDYPYEELSAVQYNDGRKWAVIWELKFMEVAARAGFVIEKEEEPSADIVDMYCKNQAHLLAGEWADFPIDSP